MTTRMRASARRRQLLEVAADVFAHKGYRGATTAELAREAGITEPILYRHFANKLDLFATLVDEVGGEVLEAWRSALEGVDDPHERLRVLLAGNPATHDRGRNVYRVLFHAMTETAEDPEIIKPLRRHLRQLQSFLSTELEHLQDDGAVNPAHNPDALAWLLVYIAIGYGMVSPLQVPGQQTAAAATTLQQLVATLLKP